MSLRDIQRKVVVNVDNNFCRRNEKWVVLLPLLEKFFGCVSEATEVPPITKPVHTALR